MNWRFWQKSAEQGSQGGSRTIPEPVARYTVVELKQKAEWVWNLMAVERSCPETRHDYRVRVFEAMKVNAANVHVKDYRSLDNYPELIVLQGRYSKKTGDVRLDPDWELRLKAA